MLRSVYQLENNEENPIFGKRALLKEELINSIMEQFRFIQNTADSTGSELNYLHLFLKELNYVQFKDFQFVKNLINNSQNFFTENLLIEAFKLFKRLDPEVIE